MPGLWLLKIHWNKLVSSLRPQALQQLLDPCPLCTAMAGKVMNSVMIRRVKKYDNDFITPDRIHEQALRSEGEGGDEDDSRGDGGDEEEEEEVAEEGEDEEEEDEVVVIDEEDEPTETQGRLREDLKKRREKALGCLKRIFQVL